MRSISALPTTASQLGGRVRRVPSEEYEERLVCTSGDRKLIILCAGNAVMFFILLWLFVRYTALVVDCNYMFEQEHEEEEDYEYNSFDLSQKQDF